MQRMEDAFDALRRIVYRSGGSLMGTPREAWDTRIDALYDRAMAAREASDGPTWRRVFNEVQALSETAYQEEFSQMRLDDPAYIQNRVSTLLWRAQRLEGEIGELVLSSTPEIRAMQAGEQERLQKWIVKGALDPLRVLRDEKPGREPSSVRRELDQIHSEMERIEAAAERLPSIGLVTDRGASS